MAKISSLSRITVLIIISSFFLISSIFSVPSQASVPETIRKDTVVLRYDPGGRMKDYIQRVQIYNQFGKNLEIRGTCNSSCTMLLGVKNVCVTPEARFGFHGPRYLDRQIPEERFEYWSHVMASHYPIRIADWYLKTARYETKGLKILKGSNLIEHGVPQCQPSH